MPATAVSAGGRWAAPGRGAPTPPLPARGGGGGRGRAGRGGDAGAGFARQWPKTVAAITKLNPDVLGIMEIENDGYGPDSAIQFLVGKLNAATSTGKYAFVDA